MITRSTTSTSLSAPSHRVGIDACAAAGSIGRQGTALQVQPPWTPKRLVGRFDPYRGRPAGSPLVMMPLKPPLRALSRSQ